MSGPDPVATFRDQRCSVATQLDHVVRLREATPGRPEDGPYPASVGEVAHEVVAWLREMDRTSARGLIAAVLAEFSAVAVQTTDTEERR